MFNEDFSGNHLCENDEEKPEVFFSPNLQRLKWKHKRTYFKLRVSSKPVFSTPTTGQGLFEEHISGSLSF